MGRIVAPTADTLDQPLSLIAAAAVAAGDLLKLEASNGQVRKMVAEYTIAQQNTPAGATMLKSRDVVDLGVFGNTNSNYGLCMRNIVPTPDGGWATVYPGNGSNSTSTINFALYTAGRARKFKSTLTASTSVNNARLTKAGADNVMAVWNESTTLYGAVLNKTSGAVVAAAFTIGTVAAAQTGTDWNLATLANGDVVVAYSGAGNAAFKRYSSTGVLQGAEVVVEAASIPNYFTILALAAGGFVVRYARTAATQGVKLARYNAAGVLQGAVVSVTSGSGLYEGGSSIELSNGAIEHKIAELSNGSIVTINPAVLTEISFKIYDGALNLLTTVVVWTGVTSGYHGTPVVCAKSGGGFYFSSWYNNTMQQYDNAGVLTRSGTGAAFSIRLFDRPGTGLVAVTYGQSAGASSSVVALAMDSNLAIEGTQLTVVNNASNQMGQGWAELLDSGLLVIGYSGNSSSAYYGQAVVSVTAASVVGVAGYAAAAGAPVRLSTTGKFLIGQAFTTESFDRRASVPAGSKGSVVGSMAVLQGTAG